MQLPTAQDLSEAFLECLRDMTTPDEWRLMDERNDSETDDNICHSHDFCDANVAMLEAFTVLGVPEDLVVGQNDEIMRLWSEAWTLAKDAGFYDEHEERQHNHSLESRGE